MALSLQSLRSLKIPSFSLKRKQDLIGIDIGTHAIKVVSLRKSSGHWALVRWGVLSYGEEIPLDTALIDRRSQAVAALQNYLKTAELPTKKVATSLSGNSVIVRYVKMGKMTPQELSKS